MATNCSIFVWDIPNKKSPNEFGLYAANTAHYIQIQFLISDLDS